MKPPALSDRRRQLLGATAQALAEAFKQGRQLDDVTQEGQPTTLAEAWHLQDVLVDALGGHGGWKVSPARPDREPGCAPIARERIFASPAAWQAPLGTALQVEVEVAVTFAHDLTGPATFTAGDIRGAIAALHPAFEVVSSRLRHKDQLPDICGVADLQSNAALVLGPGTAAWQALDLGRLRMDLLVDGQSVAQASEGTPLATMIDSLVWLANHARDRGRPLRRTDAILTGARILPTTIAPGAMAVARVEHLGEVALRA
jgi:2-keto-4-pentenoate hydratase